MPRAFVQLKTRAALAAYIFSPGGYVLWYSAGSGLYRHYRRWASLDPHWVSVSCVHGALQSCAPSLQDALPGFEWILASASDASSTFS